ncbi:hypothetical protein DTO166G4_7855 [Paecilomyces variotii]|nr:hypothetical protein DTO164E3_1928 [Paecilomyces variotii]KAJ9210543.1 hypothetical protein DTO166G4_7855 [Paecilomyces variotii]
MTNTQQSPYANDEYTVGWICALPPEFAAAKGMLDEEHGEPQTLQASADDNPYFLGSIGKFKVVIACLPLHQIGPASAASAAKEMLFTFPKIRVGLLVGIGAGIPDDDDDDPEIHLGDIVISSSPKSGGVVVYDFGKQLSDGSFESLSVLNRPPRSLASGLTKLQAEHDMNGNKVVHYIEQMLDKYPNMRNNGYTYPGRSLDRLFQPNYPHIGGRTCKKCEESGQVDRDERQDDAPRIHYGTIASGSMVVKDPVKRDKIREKHGAICLEMEAAGLMNIFPCIVIRGISDYADSHKNDGWQKYAAAAAAACAKEFLSCVQSKIIDGEPAAKDLLNQVRDEVVKASKFVSTEQTRQILEWLTPLNFDDIQNDLLGRRQEGTGLWLLNSEEFTQWMSQPKQTLFCPGIPGAGKTIMSSIVVEHLKGKSQENPEIQTCCIFCSFQPNHQQRILDLLLSLLRQLAVKGSALLQNIEDMHTRHIQRKTRPTFTEVQSELVRTANCYEMIFIVIDALDEYCSSNSEELHKFLSTLFNLQKDAPINILATSRFNSGIMSRFERCPQKEIRAQEDDIQIYLNGRIPSLLEKKISLFPSCQDDVRREVLKSADGMFLLAKLHMDNLMGHITVGELEEALINLPHGETKLELTYHETIKRIKSQHYSRYQKALQILSWLTYCRRVLFAQELQHALATRPGDKDLDRRFLPELDIIDSLCAGLVVFDQRSGIIRLAHYTTKEYLIDHPDLQNSETEITQTCITYLSFSCFSSGRSSSTYDYTFRQKEYPLHHYSAQNWALHASQALASSLEQAEKLTDFILEFLDKKSNMQAAGQVMLDRFPHRLTKVHLAAYGGLSIMISKYISSDEDVDARDSNDMTPLAYAAQNGHLQAIKLLLRSNRVHPDVRNNCGQTPLILAACGGHKEVIEVLLRYGACPDTKDKRGYDPLSEAARTGRVDIMKILLDKGVPIDYICEAQMCGPLIERNTPLMLSRRSNNRQAMWLLLDKGADLDFPTGTGDTLLTQAIRDGDQELVDYFLKRGFFVDFVDRSGYTPLHYAVRRGHGTIVKSFLNAGCDVDLQFYRETCLMTAIEHGHGDIAAQLLEHGANLNLQNQRLETALFYAVRASNADMVETLLEHGASPNVRNSQEETPLFTSATAGDEAILRCLLSKGADPLIRNNHQQTALFLAADYGHTSIVGCLIDVGLDVNDQDDRGNTAIFHSARSGKTDTMKILLENGADVHHRNVLGETALFYAARNGKLEICEILIQNHAELDARNLLMETPLVHAASGPYIRPLESGALDYSQVVRLFIQNGADPNPSYDLESDVQHPEAWKVLLSPRISSLRKEYSESRLRLCEAARQIWDSRIKSYSDDQVLDFLHRVLPPKSPFHGVNRRKESTAPLLFAIRGGNAELAKIFLRCGQRIDSLTEPVQEILRRAVDSGHRSIVELVLKEEPDEDVDIPSLVLHAAEKKYTGLFNPLMTEQEVNLKTANMDLPSLVLHAERKHTDLFKFLMTEQKVNPKTANVDIPSLVLRVAEMGNTGMLKYLIKEQEVNLQTASEVLLLAAHGGKTEVVRFLLENGAKPTFVTRNAQSALHGAVLKNATELVELLLQQEINIDARDKHGRTPLFYAVQRCRTPIVQMLLEAGADSNISEDDFTEPILYDTNDQRRIFSDLNTRNSENLFGGLTPLFFAAGNGNDATVKLLLSHGAIPDVQDRFGERPINWAAARGFEAIVKMLLDSGANANQLDHPSQSPLLWALGVYNHDFSKKLYRGRSPLRGNHFAFGDAEAVLDLLLKNGADPNVIDEDGRTPLYLSVKLGLNSKALVRSFLRAGCDPNRKDKYGRTPLMGATVRGMTKFVTALLEAPNLDRDATDNFGRTALLEATARNKPLIRDILLQPSAETQMAHPSTSLDEQISYPGHLCGICGVHEWRDLAYHCSICDEGHFDMCEECKKWGATCLDATHEMTRRFDIVGGRASDIGIYILSEAELAELGGARKAQEKPDRMSAYRQAPKFFQ